MLASLTEARQPKHCIFVSQQCIIFVSQQKQRFATPGHRNPTWATTTIFPSLDCHMLWSTSTTTDNSFFSSRSITNSRFFIPTSSRKSSWWRHAICDVVSRTPFTAQRRAQGIKYHSISTVITCCLQILTAQRKSCKILHLGRQILSASFEFLDWPPAHAGSCGTICCCPSTFRDNIYVRVWLSWAAEHDKVNNGRDVWLEGQHFWCKRPLKVTVKEIYCNGFNRRYRLTPFQIENNSERRVWSTSKSR